MSDLLPYDGPETARLDQIAFYEEARALIEEVAAGDPDGVICDPSVPVPFVVERVEDEASQAAGLIVPRVRRLLCVGATHPKQRDDIVWGLGQLSAFARERTISFELSNIRERVGFGSIRAALASSTDKGFVSHVFGKLRDREGDEMRFAKYALHADAEGGVQLSGLDGHDTPHVLTGPTSRYHARLFLAGCAKGLYHIKKARRAAEQTSE